MKEKRPHIITLRLSNRERQMLDELVEEVEESQSMVIRHLVREYWKYSNSR